LYSACYAASGGPDHGRTRMSDMGSIARELLATALGVPENAVGPKTEIGASPEWDSMAHMRLILGIEKTLGHVLSARAILDISSFEDVISSLK